MSTQILDHINSSGFEQPNNENSEFNSNILEDEIHNEKEADYQSTESDYEEAKELPHSD